MCAVHVSKRPARMLCVAVLLACSRQHVASSQPGASPSPDSHSIAARNADGGVRDGGADAADAGDPSRPRLLSAYDELDFSVAFHLRPGTKELADLSIMLSGPPNREGVCPSCLNVTAEIDGRITHAPERPRPPQQCTRIRVAPQPYRSCESIDDAWIDWLDLAAVPPNRDVSVTIFRVSDGTQTYTAAFANLFSERKLVLLGSKAGVVRPGDTLELAVSPSSDRILMEDQGATPDVELHHSDGSRIALEHELSETRVRIHLPRDGMKPGPATLVLRYVDLSVGEVRCTGPRFCRAIVPGLIEEKRVPVVVAP